MATSCPKGQKMSLFVRVAKVFDSDYGSHRTRKCS
jgi:hypothetical protein